MPFRFISQVLFSFRFTTETKIWVHIRLKVELLNKGHIWDINLGLCRKVDCFQRLFLIVVIIFTEQ